MLPTAARVQAVLLLAGVSEDDAHNWGKMRVATNYKLIKKLTELKPDRVDQKLLVKVMIVQHHITLIHNHQATAHNTTKHMDHTTP